MFGPPLKSSWIRRNTRGRLVNIYVYILLLNDIFFEHIFIKLRCQLLIGGAGVVGEGGITFSTSNFRFAGSQQRRALGDADDSSPCVSPHPPTQTIQCQDSSAN